MTPDKTHILAGTSYSFMVGNFKKPVDTLLKFEEAARHLCSLKGLDPEKVVSGPLDFSSNVHVAIHRPEVLWRCMARQIQDAVHMQEAIGLL